MSIKFFWLTTLLLLSACAPTSLPTTNPMPMGEPTVTLTATSTPTILPTVAPTSTPRPTETPSSTATATSSATPDSKYARDHIVDNLRFSESTKTGTFTISMAKDNPSDHNLYINNGEAGMAIVDKFINDLLHYKNDKSQIGVPDQLRFPRYGKSSPASSEPIKTTDVKQIQAIVVGNGNISGYYKLDNLKSMDVYFKDGKLVYIFYFKEPLYSIVMSTENKGVGVANSIMAYIGQSLFLSGFQKSGTYFNSEDSDQKEFTAFNEVLGLGKDDGMWTMNPNPIYGAYTSIIAAR